jgi:glutamyl-tRNA reductase
MNIAVVGLSHKTAPVEVREKLSIPEAQIESAIARLCRYPHIEEAAILSTCNRLEIYVVVTQAEQVEQEVTQFLAEHSQLPLDALHQHLFTLLHWGAAKHLMWVASGLDSLVIGEGQILAQVKHAYKVGQQHGGIRRILNQLFKQAVTAGKRVRSETSIGKGAVSVSSAAVELAETKVQSLAGCRVAIVGAGQMARRLVQHLLAKGVTQIAIINRSFERAKELIDQFGLVQLQYYPLPEMLPVVAVSDLVFTCTAATEPLLNRANLQTILEPNQPLLLFDISVPRNVDADVNQLDQVRVFNVDDLKVVVAQNQETRRLVAMEAQALIEEELKTFYSWCRSQAAVSTINCLREKVETIREQEFRKTLSRLGAEFPKKHHDAIEALTRGIVNKILHEPMVQLRTQQDVETLRLAIRTVQTLFNLENEEQYSLTTEDQFNWIKEVALQAVEEQYSLAKEVTTSKRQ